MQSAATCIQLSACIGAPRTPYFDEHRAGCLADHEQHHENVALGSFKSLPEGPELWGVQDGVYQGGKGWGHGAFHSMCGFSTWVVGMRLSGQHIAPSLHGCALNNPWHAGNFQQAIVNTTHFGIFF